MCKVKTVFPLDFRTVRCFPQDEQISVSGLKRTVGIPSNSADGEQEAAILTSKNLNVEMASNPTFFLTAHAAEKNLESHEIPQ